LSAGRAVSPERTVVLDLAEEKSMTTPDVHDQEQLKRAVDVASVSERLAETYQKEAELYQSILRLTELQRAKLDESDGIRSFVALLHEKEDVIRSVDRIEIAAETDKELWLELPEEQRDPWNQRLNSVLDGIIVLIEQTMQLERENEELLRTKKDEIERELETIRRGHKAAGEYKAGPDAKVISRVT
jgi:hypothetical protein